MLKIKSLLKKYNITNAKPIDQADKNSITWLKEGGDYELIEETKAKIIICHNMLPFITTNKRLIFEVNPKLVFMRIVRDYFPPKPPKIKMGIGIKIGKGTIIGADGFGYERNEKNELEFFPHIGGVIIEDDVEIGCNVCIDRGVLGDTIIHKGVKIDNLVHIAHNVEIGKHTAIIANAMIGGSVKIGSYSWIAPSASILNGVTIGNNVIIGMGAVVLKDISDGETWAGVPAKKLR